LVTSVTERNSESTAEFFHGLLTNGIFEGLCFQLPQEPDTFPWVSAVLSDATLQRLDAPGGVQLHRGARVPDVSLHPGRLFVPGH